MEYDLRGKKVAMNRKMERNSNIELLRIVSMVMVLVLHCLATGGALDYNSGINLFVYWWIEALAIVAVDVFVLISGYFLVETRFKAENVFKVAIEGVWIYSVIFTFIAMKMNPQTVGTSTMVKAFFPILTKKYWFVNSYVLMYMLSPYINKLIHSLSKRHFSMLLVYLVVFFSIRPTIFPLTWSQDATGGMGIISFIMLYCIGAWIRKYYKRNEKIMGWLFAYIGMSILLLVSKIVCIKLGMESLSTKFYGYESPVVIMEAVALFLVFLNRKAMKQMYITPINKIAKHSFSVYIIHFSILNILFIKIFHIKDYISNVGRGVLAIIISVLSIYAVCTVIDIAKCYAFEEVGKLLRHTSAARKYNKVCIKWESMIDEIH